MKVWGVEVLLSLAWRTNSVSSTRANPIHLSSPISFDAALRPISCRPLWAPDSEGGDYVSKKVVLRRHGTVKLGQTRKIDLAILTSLKYCSEHSCVLA